MQIRVGYELVYAFPQPTPIILALNIHYSRASDIVRPDHMISSPSIPVVSYRDIFGNWCNRVVAPQGRLRLSADGVVNDTGAPDVVSPLAEQHAIEALPEEALMFLLGSRYCETDLLSETAWKLFAGAPTGWGRVQAICDFVHRHITFDYAALRSDGLRRLVRSLSRWGVAHVRPPKQHPAHRPRADCSRPRCDRCRNRHDVRPEHPREFSRMDRRGSDGAVDVNPVPPTRAKGHDVLPYPGF